MNTVITATAIAVGLITAPIEVAAQQSTLILNYNDYYHPESATVTQGETVTFENPRTLPITHHHDLFFTNNTHPGHDFGSAWTHDVVFNNVGTFEFGCSRHGERGTITVLPGNGEVEPDTIDMNPGLNGNWWNGPARNGEGVQFEISDAGSGEMVLVATIYAYSPDGEQIFMIAVGNPSGGTADVEVFITEGGTWGAGLGANDVSEVQWGTGRFVSESCTLIHMELSPGADYVSQGYSVLAYELERLTTPLHGCPQEP